MFVQERIYNHFLNLVENKKFAKSYFRNKDIAQFNNQKLVELRSNLKKVQFKYDEMTLLLGVVHILGIKQLISKVSLKTETVHQDLRNCINDLDIFEANLAFLMISGVIGIENCESLGFDYEYIKELIYGYKKQIKNPYVEYYYDEKTGRTARVIASGKMVILPYTPMAVKDKLGDKYSKKRC